MDASEEGFVTGGKDGMAKLWDSDFKNITTVNLASAPGGYKGSACESSNLEVLSVECTWTCCLPCWLMGCWLGWFSWMCCSWKNMLCKATVTHSELHTNSVQMQWQQRYSCLCEALRAHLEMMCSTHVHKNKYRKNVWWVGNDKILAQIEDGDLLNFDTVRDGG